MVSAQRNHGNEEQREPPFRFHGREHGRPRALRAGILNLPDGRGFRAHSEEEKHTETSFSGESRRTVARVHRPDSGTEVSARSDTSLAVKNCAGNNYLALTCAEPWGRDVSTRWCNRE